jgi:hypothetical protein
MAQLPINMGPSGPIPTLPADLRAKLVAKVAATNPGYTANLPGSLVEDIVSTDVGALVIANQFLIDLVNSISPFAANAFLLNQLGVDVYGIQPANAANTSVDLIFSGTPGFIIIPGFTVSDGSYQYICQDGGVIGTDGNSLPIHAISPFVGTWSVEQNTVTQLITSVPTSVTLSVTNPTNGLPSIQSEDMTSFRTRTLTAGLVSATGTDRFLKTLLWNIPDVVQRLVSVRQNIDTGRWTILVRGGDPYQVAWAIYYSGANVATLDKPTINIIDMSNTSPVVVTTEFTHNISTGMIEKLFQIYGFTGFDQTQKYLIKNISYNQFSLYYQNDDPTNITPTNPVDGTKFTDYVSGGIVTPNPILQEISLNSYPDTYLIPFILPAQETVTLNINWNTDSVNYVSDVAINTSVIPALIDYINSIYVGTTPISIFELQRIFIDSISDILSEENITVLNFAVSFNGIGHIPEMGTGVIYGDPYSYFYTDSTQIFISRSV